MVLLSGHRRCHPARPARATPRPNQLNGLDANNPAALPLLLVWPSCCPCLAVANPLTPAPHRTAPHHTTHVSTSAGGNPFLAESCTAPWLANGPAPNSHDAVIDLPPIVPHPRQPYLASRRGRLLSPVISAVVLGAGGAPPGRPSPVGQRPNGWLSGGRPASRDAACQKLDIGSLVAADPRSRSVAWCRRTFHLPVAAVQL